MGACIWAVQRFKCPADLLDFEVFVRQSRQAGLRGLSCAVYHVGGI